MASRDPHDGSRDPHAGSRDPHAVLWLVIWTFVAAAIGFALGRVSYLVERGDLGGECYPNGTCRVGLACRQAGAPGDDAFYCELPSSPSVRGERGERGEP